MNTTSSSLLMRLKQPGEELAWERFVQLYTPLLYFWAQRWGLQNQDAGDLVQEILVTMVKKLPEFDYDSNKGFRNWLRRVAVNKWHDFGRRRGKQEGSDGSLGDVAAPAEADELAEAEYRQHVVSRALELMQAEFAPKMWKACWETVVVGRSAAEVAAELEIAEGTVYVAKSRVLARLRQELAGLLD